MVVPVGDGMVAMDVVLFMGCGAACAINMYYLPAWYRASKGLALMRLLRISGWAIFFARFGNVLFTTGDLPVSLPAAIGFFFLIAGELTAIFNRGKKGQL